MTGCALARFGGCSGGWPEWHHPLPKQAIKRKFPHGAKLGADGLWEPIQRREIWEFLSMPKRTLKDLLADTRNRQWACAQHHQQIEWRRVYLDPPESAVAFAEELGLGHIFDKQRERAA